MATAPHEYVNKKEMYEEFVKLSKDPELPLNDFIGDCFIKIANGTIRMKNFSHLQASIKSDMVSLAILNMCKYAKSFNVEKSNNPFSYFTQICWNSFLQTYNKEKNEYRKVKKYFLNYNEKLYENNEVDFLNEFGEEFKLESANNFKDDDLVELAIKAKISDVNELF